MFISSYYLLLSASLIFKTWDVSAQQKCAARISREHWGNLYDAVSKSNKTVRRYSLSNCNNVTVKVISFGASINSIVTPDEKGKLDDIVLGFDNIEGYLKPENAFLGATLGRIANRISKAKFSLPNTKKTCNSTCEYKLDQNDGDATIHGGFHSFGKVLWNECENKLSDSEIILCHESPDGEGGFPGNVKASVSYKLTSKNELRIKFTASTKDKPTPINMANHAYFNLAGHSAGSQELYEHIVSIAANKYTPVDKKSIPTGEIKDVDGTVFDLRNWTTLGLAIALQLPPGFDTNFVLSCNEKSATIEKPTKPCLAARIFHPDTKRVLSVFTNQPGLQFYTSNSLNIVAGKSKTKYGKHSAFCMETQHFPDSVNQPNFPNTIVKPGELYSYESIYKFDVGKF